MASTFNMKDLSNAVADRFKLTNQSGADVVRFIFDRIKDEVVAGKQVRLHQFGTFQLRERAETRARNPITGAAVTVPARRVVKLTVSPSLKARVEN